MDVNGGMESHLCTQNGWLEMEPTKKGDKAITATEISGNETLKMAGGQQLGDRGDVPAHCCSSTSARHRFQYGQLLPPLPLQ